MSIFPLGFITPSERTADQIAAHDAAVAKMMPRFQITGTAPDPGPVVDLTALWTHPAVKSALGFEFTGTHQITGSCVGAGGGNVIFSLAAIEVLRLKEPEQIVLPFWPYTYGFSRLLMGETSEGEGSLGSTFAEAARTYGVLDNAAAGLPTPQNTDGLIWGQAVEKKWSNGKAIGREWIDAGKRHLIKTTAPIRSADELITALRNYYPVTFACSKFITPGREQQQGEYWVGRLDGNGGHQTSIQGFVTTPGGNILLDNVNQWGLKVYKGKGRSIYMEPAEVDRAIRSMDAEIFAFSQFDGFPAQTMTWANIWPRE